MVLSTPLFSQNDKSEIRYTCTNVNKKLKKLSNKNLVLLSSSYCALTLDVLRQGRCNREQLLI